MLSRWSFFTDYNRTILRDYDKINNTGNFKNVEGTTQIVKKEPHEIFQVLGIEVEDLSVKEKRQMELEGGLKVVMYMYGDSKICIGNAAKQLRKNNREDVKFLINIFLCQNHCGKMTLKYWTLKL